MKPTHGQIDVLREVANIGAGNAATSLSTMLGIKIGMQIPNVRVVPFHQLADPVGGVEASVVAIYFQLEGDFSGSMFVLMSEETAKDLLDTLFNRSTHKLPSNELEWSTLSEIGNIVAGSYLSALCDFTGLMVRPSIPYTTYDMAGAVLSVGVFEIGHSQDEALVIDTRLSSKHILAETYFVLLPYPNYLPVLYKALGVELNGH